MKRFLFVVAAVMLPTSTLSQTTQTGPLPYTLPSCTAKDAGSVSVSNVEIVGSCGAPSDTVDVSFDYSFFSNSNRYDFRFGLTTPSAGTEQVFYQTCAHDALGVTPDDPANSSAGSAIFDNIDGDGDCGDVYGGTSGTEGTVTFTMSCDPLGTGSVNPNLQASPALDWVQRAGANKGWEFEGPKCRLGDGDGLARFTIPTAAAISSVSKISNGDTGTFDYVVSNAEINDATGGDRSSITTTASGVPATDGFEFLIQDLAAPFVLTETVPAGWEITDITCNRNGVESIGTFSAATASLTIAGGTLNLGDDLACTITNALPVASDPVLTLQKVVENDDGGTATPPEWTLTATGPTTLSGPHQTSGTVAAGDYTLSETGPSGYTQTDLACDGAADTNLADGLTLATGEMVTCTFTNNDDATGVGGISLDKGADTANYNDLSDALTYTFTVTNTGDTVIAAQTPIMINDPLLGAPFSCVEQPQNLSPTEFFTCSRTYGPVSQDDIDAGQVDNAATASYTADGTTFTSGIAEAVVFADVTPALTLEKTALARDGGTQYDTLNEEIVYTFTVTNDSTQTLASVTITDPLIPTLSCTLTDLAPGDTDMTCTGSYFVTQDDLDDFSILNEAQAVGTSPTGVTVTDTDDATITIDPAAATYILALDKSSNTTTFAQVGDTISYVIEVSNIGNLTLENVVVRDPALGLTCTIGTLAPLASDDSCTGTHRVVQGDIDAGSYFNEATATATDADPVTSDVTVTGPTRTPAFTIVKTASADTDVAAGTVVTYSHLVTNTGNVTLEDITLTDTHTGAAGPQSLTFTPPGPIARLLPGAFVTVTTRYEITQDDIDNGADVTNTVTGTATPPVGTTPPTATSSEVVDLENPAPALSVVKTESDGSGTFDNLAAAGDPATTETFTFEVTNDGNVTLENFTLTDDLTGFSCPVGPIAPMTSVTTCTDGSALSTIYKVRQGDIDLGGLTNDVTVTDGTTQVSDDVTLTGPDQLPLLDMVKSSTGGAGFDAIGDLVTYDYVVTNTGNITMTAAISVADDKTNVSCPALPTGGLRPDASITCSATYGVTQEDLDAGDVTNMATASIRQPVLPSATHPTGTAEVSSDPETATVTATQLPSISIAKAITPGTPSTYAALNDSVSFQFTVTNTGNVTLSDAITVTDTNILTPTNTATTLTCPAAGPVNIAPGGTVVCTAMWSPDQGDLDAGSFVNSATADTTFDGDPVTTPAPASATANAIQAPMMDMAKELSGLLTPARIATTEFASGNIVVYSYTITNTGNTTLLGPITINDNRIGAISCPAGDLAPTDAPLVCTDEYIITDEDIALGSVTNIATATDADGTQTPPTDETVPGDADPAINMVKTANVSTFSAVDDPIIYTYTVTNTSPGAVVGGVLVRPALENPITIDDDKFADPIACLPTADNRLSPDEETTCSATYLVTQADLDAVQGDGAGGLTSAFVTNNATAQTTFGATNVASPAQSVTVQGAALPGLSVTKDVTAGNDPAAAMDMLTYTITTSNDGNQRLTGVTVTDLSIPTLECSIGGVITAAPFTLDAGQDVVCIGMYEVTQDNIDTQVLSNTASAEGTSPDGMVVGDMDTDIHQVVPDAAAVTVSKALTTGDPAAAFTDVGQPVSFTITVTNSGNVTLSTITVTDTVQDTSSGDLVLGSCTVGPLAPMQSDSTCTFIYETEQADIDNGEITNVAAAVATPVSPNSADVSDDDTLIVQGPAFEPSLSVIKSANVTAFLAENDEIIYTYVIANTGNVTITDQPTLRDDKIDAANLTCEAIPAGGLAPISSIECTGVYSVTQNDVDTGGVTNIASVTVPNIYNSGEPIEATDTVTVPSVRTPNMTILKEVSVTTDVAAGDTVTYTYTVTNTGNVTLEPIALTDDHTSAAGTAALAIEGGGVIATLVPDGIAVLTASYLVTQADIDAGITLANTVTATPTPPTGTTLDPVEASETVTVEAPAPLLEVFKTVLTAPDPIVPTSMVTFQITVKNIGNVSLTDIGLVDTLRRADTTLIQPNPEPAYQSGDLGVADTLDVDETWTYTVSHEITQADIDAGGISNSVVASGTDPFDRQADDTSDDTTGAGSKPTVLTIGSMPAILGLKTITSSTIVVDETVTFEITIENTGNVTLTNVAVASDTLTRSDPAATPLTLASGPTFVSATASSADGTLLVDEIATYRATYVLAQDDIDAGGITNTATVTGQSPNGSETTDITDNGAGAGDDPTSLVIASSPAISMVKSLFSGGPTYDTVDQELVFNFTVTNDGNITLTDAITITDAMITDAGETITCAPTPLAPGDTLICSGSYFITQDDLDKGEITNSATAQSTEAPVSDPSNVTVLAQQNPELEMLKVAGDIEPEDFKVDATASYTYTVTNVGNVTVTDPITISDNRIADADIICPAFPSAGIEPTGTYICTATYTVTVDDVALGSVTNNASATSGPTTSPLISETIPVDGVPALTTLKSLFAVNGDDTATTFSEVGDILTYQFTVTNSGNVSFSNDVTVVDPMITESPITCFTSTTENPDLIAGESVTCQGTYAVTQVDLDNGEVFNEATSQTSFGVGPTIVTSPAGTETTPAATYPLVALVKSVATLPVTGVDQILTYTLTITNTGNQTLTSINAVDPLLPNLVCEADELAPDAELVCSDTYQVTQGDLDTETLINTASVTALDPQGGQATGGDVLSTPMPTSDPGFTLLKTANPDPFGAINTAVVYTFAATNTGTVTLFNVMITDEIVDPAFSCTIARLDVDDTDDTCTLSYTVTQDDVDAGEIINTANATATDPFGTTTTAVDTNTATGPDQMPSLIAVKTASLGGTAVGSILTYTLAVDNTGNVSLTPPVIVDTMTRKNGSSVTLDAPFAYASGDEDGDDEIDATETWIYTATYTLGQADLNAGGLSNSAFVTAVGPDGTQATDTSDNGNGTDGNLVDDPTVIDIVPGPAINTEKVLVSGVPALDEIVTYEITATNTGNVTLINPTITDTISRLDGGDATGETTGPTLTSGNANGIDPGEQWVWTFTYKITQDDVDAGGLVNTATASGTGPDANVVDDVSDNGNDADGNTADDETRFTILPEPQLNVIKQVVSAGDGALEQVVFLVTVTNVGKVTLRDLVITDTMRNNDGTPVTPDLIEVASGDAALLPIGENMTYRVTYTLTQADVDSGGLTNSAQVTGTSPSGLTVSDISDTGDGDGDTATPVLIQQVDVLIATKTANIPTRIAPNQFEVTFTMTLENPGNVTQTGLILNDDLSAFVAPATLVRVDTPVVSGFNTGTANPAYNGTTTIGLMTADASLAALATGTIELTVVYDITNGQPAEENVFAASSDRIRAPVTASAGVIVGADPDLFVTKTVTPDRATVGQTVTYTMTFQNNLLTDEGNLSLVDAMPAGLTYTSGSATYNGAATPQPNVNGRTLSWPNVTIGAGDTVTITVDARVTDGGLGDIVNEAYVLDVSGARVSNVATATLRLPVEAVFDCADIIGKVFDDRNMNGYQDGVIEDRGISDQSYEGGKFGAAPVMAPNGEPGLPNVRLATVDGTIITTDEYGRYSVPCADLPGDIGSNFTLKLDTRSLPSGYQVTTENPRVIRVTAGTLARLSFGATIATVVDIDLMDSAFAPGSATLTPALIQGVDQLVRVLEQDPSILRLTYYRESESTDLARARLDAIEALIRERWRNTNAGRLPIERTINRLQ